MDTSGVERAGAPGGRNGASTTPTAIAQDLLAACRAGEDLDPPLAALATLTEAELRPIRTDRERALAFWSNCYNAGSQYLLEHHPDRYESPLRFVRFFRSPCLTVAGRSLSLDDIEHGILRGRSKYGLGYLPRFLVDSFEQRYRLDRPDPRIHFALNCGAASCPPIRTYDPDRIDEQLDRATRAYLDATVDYDAEAGTVRVPRLFLWYRGDFGGRSGIRDLLREHAVLPASVSPRIRHQPWDWTRTPGAFGEQTRRE